MRKIFCFDAHAFHLTSHWAYFSMTKLKRRVCNFPVLLHVAMPSPVESTPVAHKGFRLLTSESCSSEGVTHVSVLLRFLFLSHKHGVTKENRLTNLLRPNHLVRPVSTLKALLICSCSARFYAVNLGVFVQNFSSAGRGMTRVLNSVWVLKSYFLTTSWHICLH